MNRQSFLSELANVTGVSLDYDCLHMLESPNIMLMLKSITRRQWNGCQRYFALHKSHTVNTSAIFGYSSMKEPLCADIPSFI